MVGAAKVGELTGPEYSRQGAPTLRPLAFLLDAVEIVSYFLCDNIFYLN